MRLVSSSSAAISSSRRTLFDLEESLLRIFSNTFSTGSLVVLGIIEPRCRKEALSSDYHPRAIDCRRDRVFGYSPGFYLGTCVTPTTILRSIAALRAVRC